MSESHQVGSSNGPQFREPSLHEGGGIGGGVCMCVAPTRAPQTGAHQRARSQHVRTKSACTNWRAPHAPARTHMRAHAHVNTYVRARTHTHTYVRACARTQRHTHVHVHAHMHTHTRPPPGVAAGHRWFWRWWRCGHERLGEELFGQLLVQRLQSEHSL